MNEPGFEPVTNSMDLVKIDALINCYEFKELKFRYDLTEYKVLFKIALTVYILQYKV